VRPDHASYRNHPREAFVYGPTKLFAIHATQCIDAPLILYSIPASESSMSVLESRHFGITVGTWTAVALVVVALLAAHLVLRLWTHRQTAQQAQNASSHDSPALASWFVSCVRRMMAPLLLVLWIQLVKFAIEIVARDVPQSASIAPAIDAVEWVASCATLGALAWLLHRVGDTLERLLLTLSSRTHNVWDDILAPMAGRAGRLILPLLAIILGAPALAISDAAKKIVQDAVSMLIIGAVGFMLLQLVDVLARFVLKRQNIEESDNRRARAIYTQVTVLRKWLSAVIVVIAVASMLMVFDSVRHFGTAIIASAGLAGVVVGFAAQKTIATVLAGFQIATTQPIRIDDAVIVEGEWGQIEEITLTYVVVRIWDLRRLVLPITYFIEKPFQNWTRTSSEILGSVMLYLDYTISMEELRAEFMRILQTTPLWDQKVAVLQVTDAKERTIEIRALVSARDAGASWDLRCHVREKFIEYLQRTHPESLPQVRATIGQGVGAVPMIRRA
jgi:small-conductance mechanosensitive channel